MQILLGLKEVMKSKYENLPKRYKKRKKGETKKV